MKLLIERSDFKYDVDELKKNKEEKGKLIVSGVIQRANARNQNGRIYPKDILEREINNYMSLVKERKAVGELDHTNETTVELKNVSHIITDIWFEGDDVMGRVEILPTPKGEILRALIESEVMVGISSRAVGSVVQRGDASVVGDDLHFICWDFVSEPSTHGAWMMKEARDLSESDLRKIFSREQRIERAINELLDFDYPKRK